MPRMRKKLNWLKGLLVKILAQAFTTQLAVLDLNRCYGSFRPRKISLTTVNSVQLRLAPESSKGISTKTNSTSNFVSFFNREFLLGEWLFETPLILEAIFYYSEN